MQILNKILDSVYYPMYYIPSPLHIFLLAVSWFLWSYHIQNANQRKMW